MSAGQQLPLKEWTPELAGEQLVEAFRRLPGIPVYSPNRDAFVPLHGAEARPLALLAVTSLCLGRETDLRVRLLTWARLRAAGGSVRDFCREKGWPRSTFERERAEALSRIAHFLNALQPPP